MNKELEDFIGRTCKMDKPLPPKENNRRGLFFDNPDKCVGCGKPLWGMPQTAAFVLCNDCWPLIKPKGANED